MKIMRKIIEIDEELCDGCGQCVPACAEGAIEIIDGKARLVAEKYCDGLGACLGDCPTGALKIVEREAEDFDEEAVEEYLASRKSGLQEPEPVMACGCPSQLMEQFTITSPCSEANRPAIHSDAGSELSHWPIQIRLVPPTAPFLKNADLLIVADCTPVAYPEFHRNLLKDRVVLMGCPKFDDAEDYIRRFRDIFTAADIKSITAVIMEVPCCSSMMTILKKALEEAGRDISIKTVAISTRGDIIKNGT
ncbi:MAG TPA: 4Fe-4S ferredoxin [Thermodesulfobacteriaceae bacterium]|nr:4Fe-4S ferredoxin [Thermodesulfobacteriaceae bacterium]